MTQRFERELAADLVWFLDLKKWDAIFDVTAVIEYGLQKRKWKIVADGEGEPK